MTDEGYQWAKTIAFCLTEDKNLNRVREVSQMYLKRAHDSVIILWVAKITDDLLLGDTPAET